MERSCLISTPRTSSKRAIGLPGESRASPIWFRGTLGVTVKQPRRPLRPIRCPQPLGRGRRLGFSRWGERPAAEPIRLRALGFVGDLQRGGFLSRFDLRGRLLLRCGLGHRSSFVFGWPASAQSKGPPAHRRNALKRTLFAAATNGDCGVGPVQALQVTFILTKPLAGWGPTKPRAVCQCRRCGLRTGSIGLGRCRRRHDRPGVLPSRQPETRPPQ